MNELSNEGSNLNLNNELHYFMVKFKHLRTRFLARNEIKASHIAIRLHTYNESIHSFIKIKSFKTVETFCINFLRKINNLTQ